jgi:hypothetical protein
MPYKKAWNSQHGLANYAWNHVDSSRSGRYIDFPAWNAGQPAMNQAPCKSEKDALAYTHPGRKMLTSKTPEIG